MLKNFFATAFITVGITVAMNAQSFKQGEQVLNFGIGFGSAVAPGAIGLQPISVSYEKGIWSGLIDRDVISLGGYAGFATSAKSIPGLSSEYKYTNLVIAGRGVIHYPFVKNSKLDLYGGLMLGYDISTVKTEPQISGAPLPTVGGPFWSVFAGARYYFAGQLAGFGEVSHGLSFLTVGLAYKF